MNTTTPHTPTPWYQLSGGVISHTVTADWANEKNLIVPAGISAANAAHLVHCVNTHAALVEALEACYSALMNETGVGIRSPEKKQAEQALALAQGKE